jgi:hypothetical protein
MDSTPTDVLTRLAPPALHHCGTVMSVEAGRYIVAGDWGSLAVKRALSCQLLPEPGDVVLVSGSLPDQAYLIAVLERRGPAPLCTALGEGVSLRVDEPGRLSVQATQSLHLKADEIGIVGRTARVLLAEVQACAKQAVFSLQSTRLIGDVLESSLGRLSQFLGSSQRTVQGLDQTRSGDIDCRAEHTVQLHGQQVFATAEKLVRLDGDQVHIG